MRILSCVGVLNIIPAVSNRGVFCTIGQKSK